MGKVKGKVQVECSRCRKPKDEKNLLKKRAYCYQCELEYQREKRAKYTELSDFQKKKVYARNRANQAIRRGKIEKQPCSVCGDIKSEMHHESYDKPFEVIWFCRKHHLEHHKKVENVF